MRGDHKLTVFAAGCGDCILIEAHHKTVLTDVHYRVGSAQDETNDEVPEAAPEFPGQDLTLM